MQKLKVKHSIRSDYTSRVIPQVEIFSGKEVVATLTPREIDKLTGGAVELRERTLEILTLYKELSSLARKAATPGRARVSTLSKMWLHRRVGFYGVAPLLTMALVSYFVWPLNGAEIVLVFLFSLIPAFISLTVYVEAGGGVYAYRRREEQAKRSLVAPFFVKPEIKWGYGGVPHMEASVVDAYGNLVKNFGSSQDSGENAIEKAQESLEDAQRLVEKASDFHSIVSGMLRITA